MVDLRGRVIDHLDEIICTHFGAVKEGTYLGGGNRALCIVRCSLFIVHCGFLADFRFHCKECSMELKDESSVCNKCGPAVPKCMVKPYEDAARKWGLISVAECKFFFFGWTCIWHTIIPLVFVFFFCL
jgi:hypothetical protein